MSVLKYTDGSTTLTFTGPTTGITTDPTDQRAEIRLDNRSQLGLLVGPQRRRMRDVLRSRG